MNKDEFKTWCPECEKWTPHILIREVPGSEATGMLGSCQYECQECHVRYWV